jgi:hypothetical protein
MAPETDGLVANLDPAFREQLLDVAWLRAKRFYSQTASAMISGGNGSL